MGGFNRTTRPISFDVGPIEIVVNAGINIDPSASFVATSVVVGAPLVIGATVSGEIVSIGATSIQASAVTAIGHVTILANSNQSMAISGNTDGVSISNDSPSSIGLGDGVAIGAFCPNSFCAGSFAYISDNSPSVIVLGNGASVDYYVENAIVLGNGAAVRNPIDVVVGDIAIGDGALTQSAGGCISLGQNAHCISFGEEGSYESISIGAFNTVDGPYIVSVGSNTLVEAKYSTGLGPSISISSTYCVGVGHGILIKSDSPSSIAIGDGAVVGDISPLSIAIGAGATIPDGLSGCHAYGAGASPTMSLEAIFDTSDLTSSFRGFDLFHGVGHKTDSGGAHLDIFKFDETTMISNGDSAMYLTYYDHTGALVCKQVFVEAVTGYLHVTP